MLSTQALLANRFAQTCDDQFMQLHERQSTKDYLGRSERAKFLRHCRRGDVMLVGSSTHLSLVVQGLDRCPYNHVMVVASGAEEGRDPRALHAFFHNDADSDFRSVGLADFLDFGLRSSPWVTSAAILRPLDGFDQLIAESAEKFALHSSIEFGNEAMLLIGAINAATRELTDQAGFGPQLGTSVWHSVLIELLGYSDPNQLTCAQSIHAGWPQGLVHNFDLDFSGFPVDWLGAIQSEDLQARASRLLEAAADPNFGIDAFRKSLEDEDVLVGSSHEDHGDHMRVVVQVLLAVCQHRINGLNIEVDSLRQSAGTDDGHPIVTAGDFWRCGTLFEADVVTWRFGS